MFELAVFEILFWESLFALAVYFITSVVTLFYWEMQGATYMRSKYIVFEWKNRIAFLGALFVYDVALFAFCLFILTRYFADMRYALSETTWLLFELSFFSLHLLFYSIRLYLFEEY